MRAVEGDKRVNIPQGITRGLLQVETWFSQQGHTLPKAENGQPLQANCLFVKAWRESARVRALLLQDKTTTDFEKDGAKALLSPISGGHSAGVPPVPIPNTVVKPTYADDTRGETCRENRSPPEYL